jgi:hypothetical protein
MVRKKDPRLSAKGVKGNVGKPLICEVMEERRWKSEKLVAELRRCP